MNEYRDEKNRLFETVFDVGMFILFKIYAMSAIFSSSSGPRWISGTL